jgi:hypothetical protein
MTQRRTPTSSAVLPALKTLEIRAAIHEDQELQPV